MLLKEDCQPIERIRSKCKPKHVSDEKVVKMEAQLISDTGQESESKTQPDMTHLLERCSIQYHVRGILAKNV